MDRSLHCLALFMLVAGCNGSSTEGEPVEEPPRPTQDASTKPAPKDGGAVDAGPHVASDALRKCAESKGDIGSIADAVARLNALAPNGSGPCFVATLPRPLSVVATNNTNSAQPATGRGAPRLFLMLPKVVISAVPSGAGATVLEFGEWVGSTRTLKAEIGLPVTATLAAAAPFERILDGTSRTSCATCHRDEDPHPTIPNAFTSVAFKPSPGTFVTMTELEELHTLCTNADDPGQRCAMIHALFDFGEVKEGAFSPAVATFGVP